MSSASLDSRSLIEPAASALELALSRIIATLRAQWSCEMRMVEAEKRAATAELNAARDQLVQMRADLHAAMQQLAAMKLEQRGDKGEPGERGPPGTPGEAGRDGRDGQPGVPGDRGRDGADGKDGSDGEDGLGFDDIVQFEDKTTYGLSVIRGDAPIRSFTWPKPTLADWYYGAYENGATYPRGAIITYGGSAYLAKRATQARPESGKLDGLDWGLLAKHGLPGRSGKDGDRGPAGPAGKDGRDLTQMTFAGQKY